VKRRKTIGRRDEATEKEIIELLHCPFCGAKPTGPRVSVPYAFEIECFECGIVMEGLTEAEAITAWNTRTPPEEE